MKIMLLIEPKPTGDINGDGRSDVVCVSDDGGVKVWLADAGSDNMFSADPWTDDNLGVCADDRKVSILQVGGVVVRDHQFESH